MCQIGKKGIGHWLYASGGRPSLWHYYLEDCVPLLKAVPTEEVTLFSKICNLTVMKLCGLQSSRTPYIHLGLSYTDGIHPALTLHACIALALLKLYVWIHYIERANFCLLEDRIEATCRSKMQSFTKLIKNGWEERICKHAHWRLTECILRE